MAQTPTEKFFWRKDPTADAAQEAKSVPKEPTPAEEGLAEKKSKLKSSVLIGVPCHNSEASIAKTIIRLEPLDADIIVCDDGSQDSTEEISRKMGCIVVKHPRELGRSDSITSLYLAAKKLKAEVLLTVGSDSDFDLMDATKLVDAVQKGDVDIAIGSRYDRDELDRAHSEGLILDKESLFRSYGKKALAMISPPGTGSVVVEKEVLEFANQQGLKIREYSTSMSTAVPVKQTKIVAPHFETEFMDYVAVKHPLVFLGMPSIGLLEISILETITSTDFANASISTLGKFTISLASSPLFLVSVALSIGTGILYSQKKILSKLGDLDRKEERL